MQMPKLENKKILHEFLLTVVENSWQVKQLARILVSKSHDIQNRAQRAKIDAI